METGKTGGSGNTADTERIRGFWAWRSDQSADFQLWLRVLQTRLDGFFQSCDWLGHCTVPSVYLEKLLVCCLQCALGHYWLEFFTANQFCNTWLNLSRDVALYPSINNHVIDKHRWPVTFGSHAWPYHNIPAPCLTDKAVIRSWIQWICFFLVTLAALMDVFWQSLCFWV